MHTLWTPTLTTKEALAICGSLSNPSKMPGHGYALPAQRCRLGSLLQLIPKSVCHSCYALRGRYLFPVVRAAMEKRFASLSHPRWVEAVSTLIYHSGDRHFRWHDSGDLQDLEHLRKIVEVCLNLSRVSFWLPTREYQTVEAYRRMGKAAIVKPGQRFSLGQRVMMLRPAKNRMVPRFLLYQLLSPLIQEDLIIPLSKGSAAPHLNIGALRKFPFRVPSLPEQRRIVALIDDLQEKVDALERLQAEASKELDALIPSILDKAFRGEL